MLSVLTYFERTRTVAHYSISPRTIFYDKVSKKMVVYDNECIHGKFTSYFNFKEKKFTYISFLMKNKNKAC